MPLPRRPCLHNGKGPPAEKDKKALVRIASLTYKDTLIIYLYEHAGPSPTHAHADRHRPDLALDARNFRLRFGQFRFGAGACGSRRAMGRGCGIGRPDSGGGASADHRLDHALDVRRAVSIRPGGDEQPAVKPAPFAGNAIVHRAWPCRDGLGIFPLRQPARGAPSGRRPLPLSARFIIAGLALLFLTVSLGLAFALALTVPAAAQALGPMLANGVADHALAGLGGWFTLTAIGVSYELLPMFMLAPHERGAWGNAVFGTAILGFAAALLGGFESIKLLGQAAIGLAILLYLIDIARLYRDRKRRQIELHNQAAIGAFISLGIALVLALAAALSHGWTRAAPGLLFVVLFGWLSGLGLSQLYKIIPFLAWLARFGRRLGRGPVPRVQDLVNERYARYVFVAYFAAIAVGAAAAWLDLAPLLRGAIAVSLVATALLAREYRRAWRGHYAQTPRLAPVPGSPFHLPQP